MKTMCLALTITAASGLLAWGQGLKPVSKTDVEYMRVVADADGTTNVRSGASLNSKVTGTVKSGSVVSIIETKGDWTLIMGADPSSGDEYVHSSRLKKIDHWKTAKTKWPKNDRASVENGGVKVEVYAAPFDQTQHKVRKMPNGGLTIDGHNVWGTDGNLPGHALVLAVTVNGTPVKLPASATRDLYEPNMETLELLTPGTPAEQMTIVMWNSDGAGGYMVAWSFVKGQYAGRTIFVP